MASSSLQYDAALGGPVVLPDEIDSTAFNEERLTELKAMLRTIASTENQTKLMHQSLPLHMRRRAMSYNPKRLPRKFRTIHVNQFQRSGMPEAKKKRPSRKYRRKASNLLAEYRRRQRKNIWLETHVWHAKRYHMVTRWGYKVPYTPTSKGYRACYRATAKHCLVQDVSYYGCVEVRGEEAVLRDVLRQFCSEKVGLTIAGKAFLGGRRSGNVWMFERGQYPLGCIGRVRFVWRAKQSEGGLRSLWIFAHPAFYRKLVEELILAFNLKNVLRDEAMEVDDSMEPDLEKEMKNPSTVRVPKYVNESSGVSLLELKDTLNYFRLTGPLSHAILSKALKSYTPPVQENVQHWFSDWSRDTTHAKIFDNQNSYWDKIRNLTSPGELAPNSTLGLIIEDPRLNRPKRRTKALPPTIISPEVLPESNHRTASSPIWNETIRDQVTKEMKSTHYINQQRSKECLVPGERCLSDDRLQPVPILLLQNPGSQDGDFKRLGYGAGWDVIVPAGYGLPLWHTLILWGAKPAGLKEFDMQALESGLDTVRIPDTILGITETERESLEGWNKYFARPNNRRVNYRKLAIASPFRCPWSQLVSEWNHRNATTNDQFFVLRDQDMLSKLQLALNRRFNVKSIQLPANCLIPVFLTMKTRGNPGSNALICLPSRQDFRQNKTHKQSNDHTPVYTEPLRPDPQQNERLQLRRKHLALLKRLRNRRIRAKKALQRKSPGKLVRIAKPCNKQLIQEQLDRMRELWLPARVETVRNQCSRECFGYVTQCNFSLSEARVSALGYVTARGLEKLFKICTRGGFKVLVRGTKSRCYRFATVNVRTEW